MRGEGVVATRPVLPAEGGSIPTSPLQFVVRPLDYATAKNFVEQWHYSKCLPKGRSIRFGAFAGDTLYAVLVFGNGVNPYQARFLGVDRFFEIVRLCRCEPPRPEFPMSKFISLAIRLLLKSEPCQVVVAFADPGHGHEGTVYKAAGFTFHGLTQAEMHVVDAEGNHLHRRVAYRHSRRNGCTIEESRNILGLTPVRTLPKRRWVRYFR